MWNLEIKVECKIFKIVSLASSEVISKICTQVVISLTGFVFLLMDRIVKTNILMVLTYVGFFLNKCPFWPNLTVLFLNRN